jgi:uncharacterized protein
MKIAIVGASGMIGSRLVAEAASRGHQITALSRHPENIPTAPGVTAKAGDVFDTAALADAFRGADAVIHSYAPPPDATVRAYIQNALATNPNPMAAFMSYKPADPAAHEAHVAGRIDQQTRGTQSIIAAAKAAGVARILAVGGAGTLLVDGVRTMDRPGFPIAFDGGAKSTAVVKDILRTQSDVQWTVLCPPMSIEPGPKTGTFRLGDDDLLTAADGSSRITVDDFAVAMIDELEQPSHTGHRFTIAY